MFSSAFRRGLVLSALCAGSLSAQAQQEHKSGGNEGKLPIGWKVRADCGSDQHAGKDTLSFVQMTPGYHVTTGPGAIMWSPDSTASGTYTIDGTIFLFPTNGRDQEGYGLFVGGQGLDGTAQRYTYFLLRNDGKYLIKQRVGEKTNVLKDWTALSAVKRQTGTDAMRNDFRIAVSRGNGQLQRQRDRGGGFAARAGVTGRDLRASTEPRRERPCVEGVAREVGRGRP